MKAFLHSDMAETYYFRDIISLRGACCQYQYCKSLLKCREFWPDKKARPDLNFQAIDLKLAKIVDFYKVYHHFQLDSYKINAWPIKNAKA